ncbi:MAG: transcription termination factor NusA [Candidatus Cloacimonadia bacterium]
MPFNIIAIINEFVALKQIDRDVIVKIIQESLESIIMKRLRPDNNVSVVINFEENKVYAKISARVVDEVKKKFAEISLDEARKIDPTAEVGDYVTIEIPISDFGRKTILAARQVIMSRSREIETQQLMVDYEKQKGQIVTGIVKKVEYNGYIVDIGFTEALLPTDEQVETEFYKVGDYIKAYILDTRNQKNKVTVILSRQRPEFIRRLMENEIPEIMDGGVIVKKIVREPGYRTKVAVQATNPKIDAYGSCIGPKGRRIEAIKDELHGEQVDVVEWSENPEQLIKNSIGQELVKRVYLAEKGKFAQVIVNSEKDKNIAIGKNGKNVKLAAKLSNYKLDILLEEEYEERAAEERRITSSIYELEGATSKIGKILYEAGYTSVQDIHLASVEELCNIEGIGEKTALKLKESAKNF